MKPMLIFETLHRRLRRRRDEKKVLRFGPFEVDVDTGELRRQGISLKLQPQPSKVLLLLLSRPGELITRKDLQDRIWGTGTFVDFEQGLNWCVKRVREVLDDDASAPKYIQTVARRGYRFIGELARGKETRRTPATSAWYSKRPLIWAAISALILVLAGIGLEVRNSAAARRNQVGIIVVPFQNTTGDPKAEYLADTVTDEVINGLARLDPQHIKVVSRTSSMELKDSHLCANEIGKDFKVEYLLEGSVNRLGPGIRITAQLIRAADQEQVWADAGDYGNATLADALSRLTREAVSNVVQHR